MALHEHAFEARAAVARPAARACVERAGAELRARRESEVAAAGATLSDLRAELDRRIGYLVRAATRPGELQLYDTSFDSEPLVRPVPPPRRPVLPPDEGPPASWLR